MTQPDPTTAGPHWVHEPLEETLDGARALSVSVADHMTRGGWEQLARVAGIPTRRWRRHHPITSGAPLITTIDGRPAFDAAAWARFVSLVPGAVALPGRTADLFGVPRASLRPPGRPPLRLLDLWRARRMRARLRRFVRIADAEHARHAASVAEAVRTALANGDDGTALASLPTYALAARLELLAGATREWSLPAFVDLAAAVETAAFLREDDWSALLEAQAGAAAADVPQLAHLDALADADATTDGTARDAQLAAWCESPAGWHASRDLLVESPPLRDDLDAARAAARAWRDASARTAPPSPTTRTDTGDDRQRTLRSLTLLRERVGRDRALHVAGIRAVSWSLARALAANGVLEDADDAFDLTLDELTRVARGSTPPPQVARSSSSPAAALAALEPTPLHPAGDLRGTPACGGVHAGRIVVLDEPTLDAAVDGAVLVCRVTDPAWLPLLMRCGALVTERGSALSHAAIVARELGIPCVVAVPDARAHARRATTARVDGTAGVVAFDPPA